MMTLLTIAGFDPSSGAGLQADIKTFQRLGAYGLSVASALTIQNTMAVSEVIAVESGFLFRQLCCLAEGFKIEGVKIGMIHSEESAAAICRFLSETNINPIVIDPVISSTSGHRLMGDGTVGHLINRLLPLAYTATPNIREAEIITGHRIQSLEHMKEAAHILINMGLSAAVITGGHFSELKGAKGTLDLIYDGREFYELRGRKIDGSFHGTGCVYSSALTVFLSKGFDIFESAIRARRFVLRAVRNSYNLGSGMRILSI